MPARPNVSSLLASLKSIPPAARYVALAGALMLALYAFAFAQYAPGSAQGRLMTWYLESIAGASALALTAMGEHIHLTSATVSGRFAYVVVVDCAALDAQCLFVAAVVAFPVVIWKRALGLALGLPAIFALNVVRLVALYFAGAHSRALFERLHEEVFVFVLVACVCALFASWAIWATRVKGSPSLATAPIEPA